MPPSIPRLRACAARGCTRSSASHARLKACARCKTSYYCSTECQAADWPGHKQICDVNGSVDDVFRSLPGSSSASAGLSIELRHWESLHSPTFLLACINSMRLFETPQNIFEQALAIHVVPRDSKDPRAKFAIASASLVPFRAVSESLRNAGYEHVLGNHERQNATAISDGALGHALVLIRCEAPSLPRLLEVKPILITHEAVEAYNRSPVFIESDNLTGALQRAINEDWARLFHMSAIAVPHFLGRNGYTQTRA